MKNKEKLPKYVERKIVIKKEHTMNFTVANWLNKNEPENYTYVDFRGNKGKNPGDLEMYFLFKLNNVIL